MIVPHLAERHVMSDEKLVAADRLLTAIDAAVQRVGRPRELTETLELMVHAAVRTVPGVEHAAIALLSRDGNIDSRARTSETAAELDQLQARLGQGPAVAAIWKEPTVLVDDLSTEADHWPEFVAHARGLGVASTLTFQLYLEGDTLGVLSLYSSFAGAFTTEARTIAGLFASHAALALGGAQQVANLNKAVSTRDVIGQAKGILMERFGVSADDAFELMVQSSQQTQVKLVEVARWLTGTVGGKRAGK